MLSLASCCLLCLESEESVLHCSKIRVLWDFLFSLFGVSWILSASVKDSLLGWKGTFIAKEKGKVWNASPSCIFWTLTKTRNGIIFRK